MEVLERRIDCLRAAVRRSVIAGDRARAGALRAELRGAEHDWECALTALADSPDAGPASARSAATTTTAVTTTTTAAATTTATTTAVTTAALLPVREQVHHALALLAVPAAPKLVAEVHNTFFGEVAGVAAGKLTHLRRDEERSFRTAPHSRPYYLCSALTASHLAPARGLLAVSTWPLALRIVGPLSPRVDFLTAAINIAEHAARLPHHDVSRLLWRFAVSIPGAAGAADQPLTVAEAARAELTVHYDADRAHREAAAERAGRQLDEAEQLFGSRLRLIKASA